MTQLTWTQKSPTKAGWYWIWKSGQGIRVRNVSLSWDGLGVWDWVDGRMRWISLVEAGKDVWWCGPLEPPPLPTEE